MAVKALKIDMSKACPLCGEMGITENGKCLKCITATLASFKGRAIGFLTLTKAKTELCALIDECAKEIDQAYIKADGELAVALSLKMAGTRMVGEVEVITTINFVGERIKRASKVIVNEKQMPLPGVER